MGRLRAWLRCLLVSAAALLLPNGAVSIVIDDFEDGPGFSVSPEDRGRVQAGLDPDRVIGGARSIFVTSASAVHAPADGDDGVEMTGGGGSGPGVSIGWGTVGDGFLEDLTIGGHDRIRLTFGGESTGGMIVKATSGDLNVSVPVSFDGSGRYDVTYDEFVAEDGSSVDFTSIRRLGVQVPFPDNGGDWLLTDVRTVPEPGTATLVGLAMLGLASLRSRAPARRGSPHRA